MPFNGNGVFNPLITFIPDSPATAEDQNSQDADIAAGLSNCMTRDGQAPATNNLSMGGFQLKELAAGTNASDAATISQLNSITNLGDLKATASPNVPTKWLLCYGQAISRGTYAALFGVIGTAWGAGDSSTTFNVPDFRGRVLAGVDNMGGSAANRITNGVSGITGTTLGASGGDQNLMDHTHGVTDPQHNHGITDPTHDHTYGEAVFTLSGAGGAGNFANSEKTSNTTPSSTGITINNAATGVTVNSTGIGNSNNVQPTAMVNWIIYAGV